MNPYAQYDLTDEAIAAENELQALLGISDGTGRKRKPRDEYGNTARQIQTEKAKLNEAYGQYAPTAPEELPSGDVSIPDERGPNATPPNNGQQVEISDSYASKHRAERIQKRNIIQKMRRDEVSKTKYTNELLRGQNPEPTSLVEQFANEIDDGFDDVMDYTFGKTHLQIPDNRLLFLQSDSSFLF